jgi:hypothetical protein
LQKKVFSCLRQKNVAYPFPWGFRCKQLIVESQSSDSGNMLASIGSIAGISLPLKFKQICSSMPISAISQQPEAYCRKKSENWFPAGNAGKLLAMI